jgi:hypothetical protein
MEKEIIVFFFYFFNKKGLCMSGEKCWLEDPSSIFSSSNVMPNHSMNDAQRINAITRLIVLIAAFLFFIPIASWWKFLILGILLVLVIYWTGKRSKGLVENYRCEKKDRKENIVKIRYREPFGKNDSINQGNVRKIENVRKISLISK